MCVLQLEGRGGSEGADGTAEDSKHTREVGDGHVTVDDAQVELHPHWQKAGVTVSSLSELAGHRNSVPELGRPPSSTPGEP